MVWQNEEVLRLIVEFKEFPDCTCGMVSKCTCQFLKKINDFQADAVFYWLK